MNTRTAVAVLVAIGTLSSALRADDWPQWRGPRRDGVWRETGIVEKFDGPELKPRWRVPVGGGYSGPTVADGRVYLTDRVREPVQIERVHCFDFKDGRQLWSFSYECKYTISYTAGPRASVTIDEGRAYSLGSMGHLFCFDAKDGTVLWKKDPVADLRVRVPTWGIAAAPLVEGELLILHVGGENGACVVALDKKTGQKRWTALDDPPSYSAPICIDQAGRRVLVVWTGTRVAGLDPKSGELYWEYPFKMRKFIDQVATPVWHNGRIFVTCFVDGSLMLRLRTDEPKVEKIWQRHGLDERNTDSLHAMICTPLLTDDHIYGCCSYGEFRCLDAHTGDRIWEDRTLTNQARWGTLHIVHNGERVFLFNERGELILGKLSPKGFEEIGRAKLLNPTRGQLNQRGGVTWSHPAFAYKHVLNRNDEELVCASLAAED